MAQRNGQQASKPFNALEALDKSLLKKSYESKQENL